MTPGRSRERDRLIVLLAAVPVASVMASVFYFIAYTTPPRRSAAPTPAPVEKTLSDGIPTESRINNPLLYTVDMPAVEDGMSVPVLIYPRGRTGVAGPEDGSWREFAHRNHVAVLGIHFRFTKSELRAKASFQFPEVWSGSATRRILLRMAAKYPVDTHALYLWGYAAGAQFAERFSLLYPEDCKAAVLIAAEGYTMPSSFVPTRFFLTVGSRDRGRERLAQRLADTAQRFGIAMTYHVEHGVGHALSQNQYAKAIRFLENEIASNR